MQTSWGGGTIEKGAMPWSHRYIGNPFFTFLVRNWFGAPINDVYCGMRAFRKDFYNSLKMRCIGMEFATEMIIKSANVGAKIKEVAITLHKDGRIQHPPHLRTIRDGWKTLCFFLLLLLRNCYFYPDSLNFSWNFRIFPRYLRNYNKQHYIWCPYNTCIVIYFKRISSITNAFTISRYK